MYTFFYTISSSRFEFIAKEWRFFRFWNMIFSYLDGHVAILQLEQMMTLENKE